MKPNVFVVGAPKCGTTSLHNYLSQHPDVCMSATKEPHFFSNDLDGSAYFGVSTLEEYEALFTDQGASQWGESSVWYLYSNDAPAQILDYSPNAKVIICIRDPLKMIPSLHKQFVRSLNEDQLSLDLAIAAQADRRIGKNVPKQAHFPFGLQYEHIAKYDLGIERYLSYFGDERVHVISADSLQRDHDGELGKVFDFLGVENVSIESTQLNRADQKRVYPAPVRQALKAFPKVAEAVASASPQTIKSLVGRVASAGETGQVIWSESVRDEVALRLRPSVQRVRELTGYELESWLDGA